MKERKQKGAKKENKDIYIYIIVCENTRQKLKQWHR